MIVPNIVSIFRGDHLKNTILITALVGAIFVMICDIIGRIIIYPYEVSVGLVIATVGSGIFLILIFKRAKHDR